MAQNQRDPYNTSRKHREEKIKQFFLFSMGVYMDFLGNQTRMNFPGNQMGDGFYWESNGMDLLGNETRVSKKIKLIR